MGTVEERLVELELRYLALEDEVEKLSGVVYEQSRLLDRQATELRRLRETLTEGGFTGVTTPHNEKPPHY